MIPACYVLQPWDQYGVDVLEGRIKVGRYVRLAVERHFRDLQQQEARGLVWRPDMAAHALAFFPRYCRHFEGEWSGQPVELAPWQAFWIAVEFGWYNRDGRRRFRTFYEEVARKNGKSTKLAGLGLYLFAADKEAGAQVYTAATKLEQAKITHAAAEMMVAKSPALRQLVQNHKNKLWIPGTANKFVPLGADAKTLDGLNVHGAIIDELHAHPSRDLWDVIDTGRGARRRSVMHAITTAGFNQEGSICLEQRNYLIRILENQGKDPALEDDSFGGVIYTLDPDDDWFDESVWCKANPNLGVSVFLEELRTQAQKARVVPTALFNFLTKRLNIWTQSVESWISLDSWDKGAAVVDAEALRHRRCYGGLDLASKTDIAAWVLLFPPEKSGEPWHVLPRFFVPADNMLVRDQKDRVSYSTWARQGYITATAGTRIDQEVIRAQILQDAANFDLQAIGFDEWNAGKLATELTEDGLQLVALSQNFQNLSDPTKELEALIKSQELAHGGHPVLRWMAGNVVVLRDSNDNYRPNKGKSREKIDGIVALVMALNRALYHAPAESFVSAYEDEVCL
ncbi:Phage terminase large subunit [Chromobacterium vaccinii]|nr:Phage terminase large subunit [Chromobacterium vaccinii]QND91638.1 Phage terminase large subunit [Chromobacterium vaccinii]